MNFIFNDMEFNRPGYLFKYIPENKTILIYNDILLYYDIVCYDEVQNIKNKKQLGIYVPIDQFDIFIDTLCQFGVEVLNDIHSDTTEKFSNDFFDFELKYRCPYGLAITSKYLQTARFSQIAGNSKYEVCFAFFADQCFYAGFAKFQGFYRKSNKK